MHKCLPLKNIMSKTSYNIPITPEEIKLTAIRAQGSGGQHVNKVSTAIHLRFDVRQSSLPDHIKQRLLSLKDNRITQDGIIIIKAQQFRSLEQNKEDAINRLQLLINTSSVPKKSRKPTRPSRNSIRKRLNTKNKRGQTKKLRSKVSD